MQHRKEYHLYQEWTSRVQAYQNTLKTAQQVRDKMPDVLSGSSVLPVLLLLDARCYFVTRYTGKRATMKRVCNNNEDRLEDGWASTSNEEYLAEFEIRAPLSLAPRGTVLCTIVKTGGGATCYM